MFLSLHQTIRITALADNEPEIDETYSIFLQTPIGPIANGSSLIDDESVAMITIPANQNPYGTFELYAPNRLERIQTLKVEYIKLFPILKLVSHLCPLKRMSVQ